MKKFYYTGRNYYGATYTETYTREGRAKKILYTLTEASRPYFRHNGRRFYLDDFLRNTAPIEIEAADGEKITLHGYEAEQYYKPLFIELDDAGEYCRVYRFEGTETDYT